MDYKMKQMQNLKKVEITDNELNYK